jgi:hypothetical protein
VFPQSCVDPFHDDVVDLAVSPEGNFPKVLMDAPWQIDGRVNDFRSGPSSGQLQGLLSQGLPPYLNLDRHRQCAWRGENDCTSIPVDARAQGAEANNIRCRASCNQLADRQDQSGRFSVQICERQS